MSIGILPSVNFTKQKRVAKPGTSVCSCIIKLISNQTKSQRKASIPTKEEQVTTNAVAVVRSVPQLGCVSQDSESLDCQTGRQHRGTRCKKSWDRFEEYGSLSLRYVMQVSGKQRTIARKDTSQKSTSAKYLRYEI